MSRVDIAIRAAAGVTVVGLAGIAGAISYSHMTELAQAHGETGWRAHMFPLSVDGIEIVASLVLLADKRAGHRSGNLPWAALIAATAASFAANVAVGGVDWIGRAVSGWPAFALLVAVKLLFGLLDHPSDRSAIAASAGLVPNLAADRAEPTSTVPTEPNDASDDRDGSGTVPDGADGRADARNGSNGMGEADTIAPGTDGSQRSPVVSPALDVSALLPAVRAARAALASSGKALSREALARQMRADGHAASNARMSALLKLLAPDSIESPGDGDTATTA